MNENIPENQLAPEYQKPFSAVTRKIGIESIKENTKIDVKESILERQKIVEVKYENKRGIFTGQIIVDRDLESDVKKLFSFIEDINKKAKDEKQKFFIESIVPISQYSWSDKDSMENNNTSAFFYRHIKGDNKNPLSLHSFGFALDLNPMENPCFYIDGTMEPENGLKTPILDKDHPIVVYMVDELGFEWGGGWDDPKDYQHFEKVLPTEDYIENYLKLVSENKDISKEVVVKRISKLISNSFTKAHFDIISELVNNEIITDKIGFAFVNSFRDLIKNK